MEQQNLGVGRQRKNRRGSNHPGENGVHQDQTVPPWRAIAMNLLAEHGLSALSTALRRRRPLTVTRTLDRVELTAEVRPAAPVWRVAMVIQVNVKEGRVQWVQTFDSVEAVQRCFGK